MVSCHASSKVYRRADFEQRNTNLPGELDAKAYHGGRDNDSDNDNFNECTAAGHMQHAERLTERKGRCRRKCFIFPGLLLLHESRTTSTAFSSPKK